MSMYTIIMNEDKSLHTSVRRTLHQHEQLADQIQFLIPQKCGLVDLAECIVLLKYTDKGNVMHSEILAKDSELYKDRLRFLLPVDSKLNYFAGNVIVRLVFMKLNEDATKLEQKAISGETVITIEASDAVNTSLDTTEKLAIMQTQLDYLKNNQANDLTLTNDLLQLSNDAGVIGKGIVLKANSDDANNCDCSDGVPVVDLNNYMDSETTDKETSDESDDIVEN